MSAPTVTTRLPLRLLLRLADAGGQETTSPYYAWFSYFPSEQQLKTMTSALIGALDPCTLAGVVGASWVIDLNITGQDSPLAGTYGSLRQRATLSLPVYGQPRAYAPALHAPRFGPGGVFGPDGQTVDPSAESIVALNAVLANVYQISAFTSCFTNQAGTAPPHGSLGPTGPVLGPISGGHLAFVPLRNRARAPQY